MEAKNDLSGFVPIDDNQIEKKSKQDFDRISSRNLDLIASNYLQQREEEKILEIEQEILLKQPKKSLNTAKNTIVPLKKNSEKDLLKNQLSQKQMDVTIDHIDDFELDATFEQELKNTNTFQGYLDIFIKKVNENVNELIVDLPQILVINKLIQRLAYDLKRHPCLSTIYFKTVNKVEKIKSKVFKWTLNQNNIKNMISLFEIVSLFVRNNNYMFTDFSPLMDVFKVEFFQKFAFEAMYPSDNDTIGYYEVAEFQKSLMDCFLRLYILFPLSKGYRIDTNSIRSMDPVMRQSYRNKNQKFYKETVEDKFNFKLFDYVMLLLRKFNLAEFPTFNSKYKPLIFVNIFDIISTAFSYGLFDAKQSSDILKSMTNVSENINDAHPRYNELFNKNLDEHIKKRNQQNETSTERASTSVGSNDDVKWPAVVSYYEEQISKIRLYCARSIFQIISLNCDNGFCDSLGKNDSLEPSKFGKQQIFGNSVLNQQISTITFNFLTKKYSTRLWQAVLSQKAIYDETDSIIADILNFYSDYSTDFFQKSLEMIHRDYVVFYLESSGTPFEVVDAIRNVNAIYSKIYLRKIGNNDSDIESSILDYCNGLISMLRAKSIEERLRTSLQLTRHNFPNLIFNFLKLFLQSEHAEGEVIKTILTLLALLLKDNYPAQNVIFSKENVDFFKLIFVGQPLLSSIMLTEIFEDDYTLFHISETAYISIFELYGTLENMFSKESDTGKLSPFFLMSVSIFNHFLIKLKKFEELQKKKVKKSDFMFSSVISRVMESVVVKTIHSPGAIINSEKLEFAGFKKSEISFGRHNQFIERQVEKGDQNIFLECMLSFYKAFLEFTFEIYTNETSQLMIRCFDKYPVQIDGFSKSAMIFRQEIGKMYERFHVFPNNRLFNCPTELKCGPEFIEKKFIPVNTGDVVNYFMSEIDWFEKFLINNEGRPHAELNPLICNYLLKGLLPGIYRYVDGINRVVNSEDSRDDIIRLYFESEVLKAKIVESLVLFEQYLGPNFLKNHKDEMRHNSEKIRIIDCNENKHSRPSIVTPKRQIKIVSVDNVEGQRSATVNNDVGSEDLGTDELFNEKFKTLQANLRRLLDVIREYYDVNKEYKHLIKLSDHNKEKAVEFKSSMRCFFRHIKDVHEIEHHDSSATKSYLSQISALRKWFRKTKRQYINSSTENEIRTFLRNNKNIKSRSEDIAVFLVDKLFHMDENVNITNPENSFLLNDAYSKYLIFINKAINWCPEISNAIVKELDSNRRKEKAVNVNNAFKQDHRDGKLAYEIKGDISLVSIVLGEDVLKRIWKIYLTLLNFIYFKTYQDAVYVQFTKIWKMIAQFLRAFCQKNSRFRELLNDSRFCVLKNDSKKDNFVSIFSENFLLLIKFLRSSRIWSNKQNTLVHSDRGQLMDILEDILVDCVSMLSKSTKIKFSDYYKYNHDIWKGIIMRQIDEESAEFLSLQIYVVVFLTRIIQHLDNEMISVMSSIYNIDELFNRMLVSVKHLYANKKGISNNHKKALKHSDKIRDLQKANVFKFHEFVEHGNEIISSPGDLLDFYKGNKQFSNHISLQFAIQIYIFLQKMACKDKFFSIYLRSKERMAKSLFTIQGHLDPDNTLVHVEDHAIFAFIMSITSSVEVMTDYSDHKLLGAPSKILTRLYYQKLPECFFTTRSMDEEFYYKAPIENPSAKMLHLHNQFFSIKEELANNYQLYQKMGYFSVLFNGDSFTVYNYVLIVLSIILNIVMLYYMNNFDEIGGRISYPENGFMGVQIVAWILAAFSLTFLTLWSVFRGPTEYRMNKNLRLIDKGKSLDEGKLSFEEKFGVIFLDCFLHNFRSNSYFFHLLFTLLGIFVDEVFFTLNFIMLMNVSGDISYILHSIVDQFDKIVGTLILLALVLYSYSYLLIMGFTESFPETGQVTCQSFYACFLNTIQLGFIPGAGIHDKLDVTSDIGTGPKFWAYFFLTLTFFILVKLILLNVIASIIIDTFKDLRDKYCRRINEQINFCFICNHSKWDIQKESIDFNKHINKSHLYWNYLFFRLTLAKDNSEKMDDINNYVRKLCDRMNFGWIPNRVLLTGKKNFKIFKGKREEIGEDEDNDEDNGCNELKEEEQLQLIEENELQEQMCSANPEEAVQETQSKEFETTKGDDGDKNSDDDDNDDNSVSDSDEEEMEDIMH